LEIGTGSGLATSWIIEGMDAASELVTVENNRLLQNIAKEQLQRQQVAFVLADGYDWIRTYSGEPFDLIFADAMPGKYDLFEEIVALVRKGGFYVIDDMLPQPNWPVGHADRVDTLVGLLEKRTDLSLTKMAWSTGIIIATKTR
jgi:predicted O-methyltransferase YrrM